METLELLGSQAYQRGLWGDYKGALTILSKAITKYPFDRRLYNDRCYYYNKVKDYKSALSDAENMLKLFPSYTRGYFRKGEIMMELKRYSEAEQAFRDVLKLDPENEEVKFNLIQAQMCQLTEGGKIWVLDAKRALDLNNYDTKQAKAFLTVGGLADTHRYRRNEIYYSDEEVEKSPSVLFKPTGGLFSPNPGGPSTLRTVKSVATPASVRSRSVSKPRPVPKPKGISVNDPLTDPNNPLKSNALWVGNITKKITEDMLEPVFAKYGKIKNIIVQHQNHCAFVNYTQPCMATAAMRKFPQKYPLEDTFLVIRFPDSAKVKNVVNFGNKKT